MLRLSFRVLYSTLAGGMSIISASTCFISIIMDRMLSKKATTHKKWNPYKYLRVKGFHLLNYSCRT